MKWAFELVSVPLLSSCLSVLGVCGEQPWRQHPQTALALEQSIRCFFRCTALVWEERQALGTLTQRHRVEKVSNMLLVCADGGMSAERDFTMHNYSGDFCSCSVSPYFSPRFSSLSGKRYLQESSSLSVTPERHRQGGNLQLHLWKKWNFPVIRVVKERKSKSRWSPLGRGVCVGGCRAAARKGFLIW